MKRLREIKCFLLDMDGTFYLGDDILPGALDFMHYITATERDFLFLTNNSSRAAGYYAGKLSRMGWQAAPRDILTSGEATALYLKAEKPGARIYLLGTPALEAEFQDHGFTVTDRNPDYVVLGFDKTLTYEKLEKACAFIRNGISFIATHPDINCPTEDGYIPDCGAMIELIKASTGATPRIIGKPNPAIVAALLRRKPYRPEELAMVGDRLYTDIATGKNAGITSILVLSGETKAEDLARSNIRPDYVFESLGALKSALAGDR
ncbi:HAD-IIA family hydrolase [Acetonema longum]|uniref:Acid sugar phosphatase n=1 Tax=Acetonema longum DSM 6540 TaxID=1009370 RepID=F7NQF6_9FIRM|nr:HAD-IIA family hydrolase [Acetonema longum]EGO61734.1 HAD family hydrolase [Acetonema longum DSM 6540]